MNILSGKWVEYEQDASFGKGILIDFYQFETDILYGLILLDNGKLIKIPIWGITVLPE